MRKIHLGKKKLAQSTLLLANQSQWPSIVQEFKNQVHMADWWGPENVLLPLNIEQVRTLHHFASQFSTRDQKLAVLPGADTWRPEIANTILKIVEEPPAFLTIVLLAESSRVLPTIQSRCRTLVVGSNSATLDTNDSRNTRWQKLLRSYDLTDPAQRHQAYALLHLTPLVHSTINLDLVIDAFNP